MGNFQEDYETQELVKSLRDAFILLRRNSTLIPIALETTHRTEQQMIMKAVIVKAIKHWYEVCNDEERLRYDARNEDTVRLCEDFCVFYRIRYG